MSTTNRKRTINKVYLVAGAGELLVFTRRQEAEQMKLKGESIIPVNLSMTQSRTVTTKFNANSNSSTTNAS